MRAQRLCSLGFAVVKCDNRGSSRRGLSFEGTIKHRLGHWEVLDQVTAVRYLVQHNIADPRRVGVYGWSYGGYLSAMCLCRAPDVFSVAVAGAPVTSWDGYDTHYTERYMGLPSQNTRGYREAAVFDHVSNMKGKLMIVHGLIDENVHFRHTARLINRLIAAGKDYDLLLFPEERHSPRRLRDRVYMEQRISDYFVRNLMHGTAGGGYQQHPHPHTHYNHQPSNTNETALVGSTSVATTSLTINHHDAMHQQQNNSGLVVPPNKSTNLLDYQQQQHQHCPQTNHYHHHHHHTNGYNGQQQQLQQPLSSLSCPVLVPPASYNSHPYNHPRHHPKQQHETATTVTGENTSSSTTNMRSCHL
mmetsp:Transcript_23219/g.23601  ORF Transcript_23219/g.23601 Transcript_23219/m.23601 type:complete len:359 (-) Transcript_23219:201-1277(-)